MKITPETKPISELFPIEAKTRYKIPLYQRNYSWYPQNIEDLFNDICSESEGYYIGNLLVAEDENKTLYEIVDGQQRLTTIALFLLALYELLSEFKTSATGDDRDEIAVTQNYIKKKLLLNGKPRLELLTRDAEVYKGHLRVLNGEEKSNFGNRVLAKRYKYIYTLLEDTFPDYSKANKFYEQLNTVELLRIKVDNMSDAFSVFSAINAKGLPLTLIDLLKSHYLGTAVKAINDEEALEYWNELISIFSDSDGNQNEQAITQYLLNNYDTFVSTEFSSITKKSALKLYEKIIEDQGYNYIFELIKNAKIFSAITSRIETHKDVTLCDEIHDRLRKLMYLDSSQAYPLLLFLLKRNDKSDIDKSSVIEILEYLINFFVRRNLVLKPKSSNIRAKIIEIVRELFNENNLNENAYRVTKDKLEKIKSTDEEFESAVFGPVYDISPQTVRFVLIQLEREFGNYFDHKQHPDNLDDYRETIKKKQVLIWTLEHILPECENLKNGWPEMISPDNVEIAKSLQRDNMHKFGNLTLTGYNSEMGDKSFIEKRDYHSSQSNDYEGLRTGLFLNQSILNNELGETFDTKDIWTLKDIDRRTKYLGELIIKKYK